MEQRHYLQVPFHVPAREVRYLIRWLQSENLWDKLPPVVANKIKTAEGSKKHLDLSKVELDAIPDDVWDNMVKKHVVVP